MAHGHDHHHHGESARDYFTEQLLTILVCGLFGFVAIRMYLSGSLGVILVPAFHIPVLVGGIGILVLVAIRAVTVWREAGAMQAHEHQHDHHHHEHHHHEHEHGEACNHDHGPGCDHEHHDHGHGHGHDHHHHAGDDHGHSHDLSWVLVRVLVLFFPIALFFLGLPSSGLSADYLQRLATQGDDEPLGNVDESKAAPKGGVVTQFDDLSKAAYDPAMRQDLEGQTAVLEGLYLSKGPKEFTLYRARQTCCAGDTVILKSRIRTDQAPSGFKNNDWVRVKGTIQFAKVQSKDGREEYVPIIRADVGDIQKLDVDPNSNFTK